MITGDYFATAVAIAKNIEIIELGDENILQEVALDCSGLRPDGDYLPHTDMDLLTSKVKVFARAKPEDKLEIVKSLQRQGLVCAMTGDGVNDAPALKNSDIGVAMGIQGTDVAKGAADMILTDDNFVSIVGAVEKGRVIYSGIQKFVAFIMSVHIGEVMQIFFCVAAGIPVMRKPLQILFLILVTDLPPALALGVEPGSKNIMRERPRPKTQPIVLSWMWRSIIINGAILSVVIAIVYFIALEHFVGGVNGDDIATLIQTENDFHPELPVHLVENWCPTAYCACRVTGKSKDDCNGSVDSRSYDMRLRLARTSAFVGVVFAENIRAYTSRSFENPFYQEIFSNVAMQKAIFLAQLALWLVLFIPGLSDTIFELEGMRMAEDGFTGFGLALCAMGGCLVLCELYKVLVKQQIRNWRERLAAEQEAAEEERKRCIAAKEPIPNEESKVSVSMVLKSFSTADKATRKASFSKGGAGEEKANHGGGDQETKGPVELKTISIEGSDDLAEGGGTQI